MHENLQKSKNSGTPLIFRPNASTFRLEYEYFLKLKVSSTSTQKSCTRVRVQYLSTPSLYILNSIATEDYKSLTKFENLEDGEIKHNLKRCM